MKNYKSTDLKFFKEQFDNYENKNMKNLVLDPNVPYNYSTIIEYFNRTNLYEFGYKSSYTYLSTSAFDKKCLYVDLNMFFGKKYCTMYPKRNILGPEPDKGFVKKIKKIGDISFEEEFQEFENLNNLTRLPPDNITEEWIKHNLNTNVELLRLENCYWLSKDLISKIGRIDDKLKEISLRNLEINNFIITNILKFARELEILDISQCQGLTAGLCDIISTFGKNLKSIKLTSLKTVINDEAMASLGNIKSLTDIDLSLCPLITDKGLYNLCSIPKNIECINLTANMKLTNIGILSIIKTWNQSLRKVTISQMYQKTVTGDICSELAKCKKLNYLDLSGCTNISCDSIGNMVSSLSNLENLNISSLPINDNIFENIVNTNKNIKILRMSNCKDLSNNILDYIINNNINSLLLLEINRTKGISDLKIEETLVKKGPNLRIIRATNLHWDLKDTGLRVPLMQKGYVKTTGKGAKKPAKKGDDVQTQYIKLMEERKPIRVLDLKL